MPALKAQISPICVVGSQSHKATPMREEILQIFGDSSTDLPATADNHDSSCVPNTFGWRSGEARMTTPAFLVELKAIGLRDLYHIQGFMNLLMKPRNGMPWTAEDKAAIRLHLKRVVASLPMLAVFTLPGGMLLLPLLAWHLDRRKRKLILSISPDSIKTPATKSAATTTETQS